MAPHNCHVKLLPFFILLLIKVTLSEEHNDGAPGYFRREYSLMKPFAGGSSLQYWRFGGSTIIHDKYIRLTSDEKSLKGNIWSSLPLFMRNWEVHLTFHVHGHNSRLFGDGFAFWYAEGSGEQGDVFGSKDFFKGLGIFFDTYANQNGEHSHEHPYISVQVNNGTVHYDHDRDGTHSELSGCSAHFRGVDSETHVLIRYNGAKKRLTVQHNIDGENEWTDCVDEHNVELPTGYSFGLSAQTGDLSDNHDVHSMKFYELSDDEEIDFTSKEYTDIIPNASGAESKRDHADDVPPTTRKQKAFTGAMIFFVFVIILGIGGFFYYQHYQKNQMKRFY